MWRAELHGFAQRSLWFVRQPNGVREKWDVTLYEMRAQEDVPQPDICLMAAQLRCPAPLWLRGVGPM